MNEPKPGDVVYVLDMDWRLVATGRLAGVRHLDTSGRADVWIETPRNGSEAETVRPVRNVCLVGGRFGLNAFVRVRR
jgi:hypothetical protein